MGFAFQATQILLWILRQQSKEQLQIIIFFFLSQYMMWILGRFAQLLGDESYSCFSCQVDV